MTTCVLIAKYLKKENYIYCPQVSLLNHMTKDTEFGELKAKEKTTYSIKW